MYRNEPVGQDVHYKAEPEPEHSLHKLSHLMQILAKDFV